MQVDLKVTPLCGAWWTACYVGVGRCASIFLAGSPSRWVPCAGDQAGSLQLGPFLFSQLCHTSHLDLGSPPLLSEYVFSHFLFSPHSLLLPLVLPPENHAVLWGLTWCCHLVCVQLTPSPQSYSSLLWWHSTPLCLHAHLFSVTRLEVYWMQTNAKV